MQKLLAEHSDSPKLATFRRVSVGPSTKKELERAWTRALRFDADSLVRDADARVWACQQLALEASTEQQIGTLRALVAVTVMTTIGLLVSRVFGAIGVHTQSTLPPRSVPPVPLHPDRKATHLDLRAIGRDFYVVVERHKHRPSE